MTNEERMDWLYRLRATLAYMDIPDDYRQKFYEALYETCTKPSYDWIPVNKKTPDPYQDILVTTTKFHWASEPVQDIVVARNFDGTVDFPAWIPFPEPYKYHKEV